MIVKQYGAISKLRNVYNIIPRNNVIMGIRERENYKAQLLEATKEKNKLADMINNNVEKASKIKIGIDALYNLLEERKKSENTQGN